MSVGQLDLSARLETPTGWVELEDEANGYCLSAESFTNSVVNHRKIEVQSEWMEGTYVARSVRDNVQEIVAVWVSGNTPNDLSNRIQVLTDGFDQLNYQIITRFGDDQTTWKCFVAGYTIATKIEMRFATSALLTATVPRLPSVNRMKVY